MRQVVGVVGLLAVLVLTGCVAPAHSPALPDRPGDDPGMSTEPAPDPEQDVLGWENGWWHDDPLPIRTEDGLNETELDALVNRTMARVEYVRLAEFDGSVPVEVLSRADFRARVTNGSSADTAEVRFQDATYEALFLVGETEDAESTRRNTTASIVQGFFVPASGRITIVTESRRPVVTERTLGHELMHALQWQRQDMSTLGGRTIEERNAASAVIEGVASYVERRYMARCGTAWECVESSDRPAADDDGNESASGDGGEIGFHRGLYVLQYFPYSDGPPFVDWIRSRGGWEAVDDLYEEPPASTEPVINPSTYGGGAPTDVTVPDESSTVWTRVARPGRRPPYQSLGQPGITAMLVYPAYDDRSQDPVVPVDRFLNLRNGSIDSADPFNYDVPPARGWDGDRLFVYADRSNRTGYVWRLAWDSRADAREFARSYRELLRYWGGEQRDGPIWRIPEGTSQFADAFALRVSGPTVTIVNAPSVRALAGVHAPVASWRNG